MWTRSYWNPDYWGPYWSASGAERQGRGAKVGGKPWNAVVVMREMESIRREEEAYHYQSILLRMEARAAEARWLRDIELAYQRKCLQWAAYSVLLSEC